jgi:nucleotide-binding universal stress UspA family protein
MDRPGDNRVVVGVDGSEASLAALRWAAEEAELRRAPLELVHVWRYVAARGAQWATRQTVHEAAEHLLSGCLARIEAHRLPEVTTTLVEGATAHALCDRAQGAAVVVIGADGHGSTISGVVGRAPCPVVVVPGPAP